GGANVPNLATRFQEFSAGQMISAPNAEEVVVSERFTRNFGFEKPNDALGQTIELLTPAQDDKSSAAKEEEEPPNFFGIPIEDDGLDESNPSGIEIRRFKVAGILSEI